MQELMKWKRFWIGIHAVFHSVRLPKVEYSLSLKQAIADANKAAQTIPTKTITETNELLYATDKIVTAEMGVTIKVKNPRTKKKSL